MPLDVLSAQHGGLDEFRVDATREIGALLKRLMDGCVEIGLHAAEGCSVKGTLWSADAERGTIGFSIDANDPNLDTLAHAGPMPAVTYLDGVKLQFEIQQAVLVHNGRSCVLRCSYPQEIFRFQRRSAYRVRPVHRNAPVVRVRHTEIPEIQLALRVLDISISGCALLMPDDLPPLRPGVLLNQVLLELDADTRFHVDLRLQHISSMPPEHRGVRLGCEFANSGGDAMRALQCFIDQTQKRSRLFV